MVLIRIKIYFIQNKKPCKITKTLKEKPKSGKIYIISRKSSKSRLNWNVTKSNTALLQYSLTILHYLCNFCSVILNKSTPNPSQIEALIIIKIITQ